MKIKNPDNVISAGIVRNEWVPAYYRTVDGKRWILRVVEDPKFTPRDDATYSLKIEPIED